VLDVRLIATDLAISIIQESAVSPVKRMMELASRVTSSDRRQA
jgi:hypothetical protein